METMTSHKKIFVLILGIFLISLVGASTLGTFKKDACINLYQHCDNCTWVNLTSIKYPNASIEILDTLMTKNTFDYNYSFCGANETGDYLYNTCGDLNGADTCENIEFEVTATGGELSQDRAIIYLGTLSIIVFLFIVNFIAIGFLPPSKIKDEEGILVGISKLKYLRPVLYITAWSLLMALMYVTSSISHLYLDIKVWKFFFNVYTIMMKLTLPIILFWFIWIFYSLFKDKEIKDMIERGVRIASV